MSEPKTDRHQFSSERQRLTGQLAAGVAHDFNNLLATVLGSLELMDRRIGRLPEAEQQRFKSLIQRSIDAVQRAGNITSKLLNFSRRQPQGPQRLDLKGLIPDLLTLAAGSLGRRIEIAVDLAPDIAPVVADPVQLETALLLLILPMREAMPEGGVLSIRAADQPPSRIRITLEHTGVHSPGIPDRLEPLLNALNAGFRLERSEISIDLPQA